METTGLYQIAVLALPTSAIAVIITKSSLFRPLRIWATARTTWIGRLFSKLISCTFCVSVWVAAGFVAIYYPVLVSQQLLVDSLAIIIDLPVSVFTIVAISAIVSGVIIKLSPFQEDSDVARDTDNSIRGRNPTNRFGSK